MKVDSIASQTNTREGQIPVLAYSDLSGKEGYLAKLYNDSGVCKATLPSAQNDLALYIIADGDTASNYVSLLPLTPSNNLRVKLNGTCSVGQQLVLDISGGNYGKVKALPETAGQYLSVGFAEEAGADEQLVRIRPSVQLVVVESNNTPALTDSTGGSATDTLAALTNIDTLTDSTGATADDTVADCSTAVTGVDGSGSNAASKADVDTRLGVINANFKELTDQAITQATFNGAVKNALASLAAKVNAILVMAKANNDMAADS